MATPKKSTFKANLKTKDIITLDSKDLTKKLHELKVEADTLKRNTIVGDVQNIHAYLVKRREVARVLTAIKAKTALKEEK
ncbi:MAG TPA: 50S ribosomal protein L29 [Patescibacteria group bacterium]|nr:50S ribosomal protein L29 [Patescibacteria group bacterium]